MFNALHHTKHRIYICIFVKNSKLETKNGLYVFEQKKTTPATKMKFHFRPETEMATKTLSFSAERGNQK